VRNDEAVILDAEIREPLLCLGTVFVGTGAGCNPYLDVVPVYAVYGSMMRWMGI
jgi:hypothetical protein